jgi:hypothetical protein
MHPPAPSSTWAGFRVKLGYLRLRVAGRMAAALPVAGLAGSGLR